MLAGLRGVIAAALVASCVSTMALAGAILPQSAMDKLADPDRIVELLSASEEARVPVIVEFAPPPVPDAASSASASDADAAHVAAIHGVQDLILGRALAPQGGVEGALADPGLNLKRMDFSPMFAITVDRETLERLAADPAVLRIHEDGVNAPYLNVGIPTSLQRIEMPAAFAAGATGTGWHVAVLDSGGRRSHKFLNTRIVSAACYSTNAYQVSSMCPGGVTESTDIDSANDCDAAGAISGCGHGTHVAGTAAGFNSSLLAGEPAFGVARDARIISINASSHFQNLGGLRLYDSDIIKGLNRVYALRNTYNIAAVNMSLGGGTYTSHCDSEVMKIPIDQLRTAGIATVIAAGNDSQNARVSFPACISSAITVASSTKVDVRSGFSNWGNLIDVVAPGSDINASVTNGSSDSSFGQYSGTSMAAPHVAGAFAALRSAVPDASVSQIENALKSTGTGVTAASVTKPRINVNSALTALGGIVVGKGEVYSPAPGTMLLGTTVTFQWDAGPGAQAFRLLAGSSIGGSQFHDSGSLGPGTLSRQVTGLPVGGSTIHVRLMTQLAGIWHHSDFTFTADDSPIKAVITAPAPGSTLTGSTVTFQWDAGLHAQGYHINVGSVVGGSQFHNSGPLAAGTLSREVTGLPTHGTTLHVRLFTQFPGGAWQSNDYTFTAYTEPRAQITSPTPGGDAARCDGELQLECRVRFTGLQDPGRLDGRGRAISRQRTTREQRTDAQCDEPAA